MAGVINHLPSLIQLRTSPLASAGEDESLWKVASAGRVHRSSVWPGSSHPPIDTRLHPGPQQLNHLQRKLVIPKRNSSGVESKIRSGGGDSETSDQRHPFSHLHIGERWREIQGANNWEGLLDPIDPALRGEAIRYGELSQVTYDAFDHGPHSRYFGSCKYSEKRLLQKLGLENRGYEVRYYLYATSGDGHPFPQFLQLFTNPQDIDYDEPDAIWEKQSNWMGYVAVATDLEEIKRLGRRDIVVVWRGTMTKLEWLENLRDYLAPTGLAPQKDGPGEGFGFVEPKVEAGFLQLYKTANENSPYTKKSPQDQFFVAITKLVKEFGDEELSITITGHSLGSALAMLSAYDLAKKRAKLPESEDVRTVPITVFSFAGPRVGNNKFCEQMDELGIKVLRFVNKNDQVPQLPGIIFNEKLKFQRSLELVWGFLQRSLELVWGLMDMLPWTYAHVGVPFYLDNRESPFLRETTDLKYTHNLEVYLHLLDGFQGTGTKFKTKPSLDRDLALVNKECDFLLEEHAIPPTWWQEENKGLVRTEDGRWIPRSRDPEDLPKYPF